MNSQYAILLYADCYVAVTGLPDPCPGPEHAVIMARFARDCLHKLTEVTAQLETTLGPGTADLALRVGLNSGPTTAGVLRGEKSRFQLFGDTVNTAARMESNSERMRIMVSQKTADLLTEAGKGHWLTPREDLVQAKGKGAMQCYWCLPKSGTGSVVSGVSRASSLGNSNSELSVIAKPDSTTSFKRLVDWNVDAFLRLLTKLVAHRTVHSIPTNELPSGATEQFSLSPPREEVTEVISLPKFDASKTTRDTAVDSVELDESVKQQLSEYIEAIAKSYQKNPFHGFEHASHVCMSTQKLLQRVTSPAESDCSDTAYGIASDPLTQLAIVFAALIHDVSERVHLWARLLFEFLIVSVISCFSSSLHFSGGPSRCTEFTVGVREDRHRGDLQQLFASRAALYYACMGPIDATQLRQSSRLYVWERY